MPILDQLKTAFTPVRSDPPLGVDARTIAVILFGLGVILSVVGCVEEQAFWPIPVVALGLTVWIVAGRMAAFFFEACYTLATERPFADVRGAADHAGRGRLQNRRMLRSLALLLWPIFLGVFCPILLIVWFVNLLYAD